MHPLKGRTPCEEVGLRKLRVPMCADYLFFFVKKEAVAFSQSDRTRAVWCRGAGGVFSLTNSRLMQKKEEEEERH